MCLTVVIYFHLSEPEEVFMICDDLNLLAHTLQKVVSSDEVVNNDQHFLVVNLIVLFHEVELSAVKSD